MNLAKAAKSQIKKRKQIKDLRIKIQELKDLPTSGDKLLVAKKVQSINDFIQQSTAMIDEVVLESSRTFSVKKEFEPVSIDTTSVIANIFNLTLENMNIVKNMNTVSHDLDESSKTPQNRFVIRKTSMNNSNVSKHTIEGK